MTRTDGRATGCADERVWGARQRIRRRRGGPGRGPTPQQPTCSRRKGIQSRRVARGCVLQIGTTEVPLSGHEALTLVEWIRHACRHKGLPFDQPSAAALELAREIERRPSQPLEVGREAMLALRAHVLRAYLVRASTTMNALLAAIERHLSTPAGPSQVKP